MSDRRGQLSAGFGAILAALIGLVVVFPHARTELLIAASVDVVVMFGVLFLRKLPRAPAARASGGDPEPFEVFPVNGPGENVFLRSQPSATAQEPDRYSVKLHIQLWSRDRVEMRDLALTYDAPGMPEKPQVFVNSRRVRIDHSFRLAAPTMLDAGRHLDIRIQQPFVSTDGSADFDYRSLTLTIRLGTPAGSKELRVGGKLGPGGELIDPTLHFATHSAGPATTDRSRASRWWTPGTTVWVALGVLVAAGLTTGGLVLATSSGHGRLRLSGDPVNAQTGHLIKLPRFKPPEPQDASLAGNDPIYVCDVTTKDCPKEPSDRPVKAHLGDVLTLTLFIHNGYADPLPLFRIYFDLSAGAAYRTSASAMIRWPEGPTPDCQTTPCEGQVLSRTVDISVSGARDAVLRYVPNSTKLFTESSRFIAHLPNGVTAYPGLLMADLGVAHSSCFDCRQDFARFIQIKVRVAS